MAEPTSRKCVACNAPATVKCGKCKTGYCSRKCKFDDSKKNHREVCGDLQLARHLERAANIIKDAYLDFCEQTWSAQVDKAEAKNSTLVILDGFSSHSTMFTKFPNQLMPDANVKAGVLGSLTSYEPFMVMRELIAQLVRCKSSRSVDHVAYSQTSPEDTCESNRCQPRVSSAQDAHLVRPRPTASRTAEPLPPYSTNHFKVSGTSWYMDLKGAQRGLDKALWDDADYKNHVEEPAICSWMIRMRRPSESQRSTVSGRQEDTWTQPLRSGWRTRQWRCPRFLSLEIELSTHIALVKRFMTTLLKRILRESRDWLWVGIARVTAHNGNHSCRPCHELSRPVTLTRSVTLVAYRYKFVLFLNVTPACHILHSGVEIFRPLSAHTLTFHCTS
jgi:hypothetical protein